MDIKFEEIVLAAWLHDAGKFAQRADISELFNKDREGQLCKNHEGGWYSHQHAVYTEGFLEKYRDIFPDGINIPNVIRLAANHHNPSCYGEWLIAQADRLSSGSDRCNIWHEAHLSDDKIKMKFYEQPMLHILSTIRFPENSNDSDKTAYCNLCPLENRAVLATEKFKTGKHEYAALWHEFVNDFVLLKGKSFDQFILALDSLLERYWWCIPSATNSDTDISLYQHAKTTAAFAAALYRYHKDTATESEYALKEEHINKFCFINGDISGIQKYIFDLKTTEDNAKLLRAKSFQVWSLSEILSQYIIKQFDVTYANIITHAGGRFILLVPNSDNSRQLLPQLQYETEDFFLNEYAGKLAAIISDGVEASQFDVRKENVQSLINRIGMAADICKQKKLQKALQKNGAVLHTFYDGFRKYGECPKCGVFPASESAAQSDSGGRECRNCKKLTETGGRLMKASVVQMYSDRLRQFGDAVKICGDISEFGYTVNQYAAGKPVLHLPYVAPQKDPESGALKTFGELAAEATGSKKLAIFKADIDDLGLIFSSSLGKRMSFSRYAEMSHMLNYFFSAYYAWFVSHENSPYRNTIYTVFSGGDDLCVLGAWDSVMRFASDFRKELLKLTNGNPDITLSGGIVLANPNVPVRNIAQGAENELEKSKNYRRNNVTVKNAVTVFGTTVDWEEYDICLAQGKKIQEYFGTNADKSDAKVSVGVVYKMLDFANRAQNVKDGRVADLLHSGIWLSSFHYLIARNINEEPVRRWFLEQFGEQTKMIHSRIAVSYALYTQR